MDRRLVFRSAVAIVAVGLARMVAWGADDVQGVSLPERALLRLGARRALHREEPSVFALSPDSKQVVVGLRGGHLVVWNAATSVRAADVKLEDDGDVTALVFAPDGKKLYTRSSRALHVIATAAWRGIARDDALGGPGAIAVSPDGAKLALDAPGGKILVLDAEKLGTVATLEGGLSETAATIAFSADGRLILSRRDGSVRLFDAASAKVVDAFDTAVKLTNCQAAVLSPDGKAVLVSSASGVDYLDAATGAPSRTLKLAEKPREVAVSPDGRRVLVQEFARIRLLDAADGKALWSCPTVAGRGVCFSPDGQRVALRDKKVVRILTAADGREPLDGHSETVWAVWFTGDGARVVSRARSDETRVWDAASGKQLACAAGKADDVLRVFSSPDAQTFLRPRGSAKKPVDVEDAAGNALRPLEGAIGYVDHVSFSADGKRVALAGGPDRPTSIWDVATGKKLVDLDHPKEQVSRIGFSSSGERLYIVRGPRIEVFDAATGKRATKEEYLEYSNPPACAALSPDGKALAWVSPYGEVQAKVVATGEQVLDTKLDALCVAFAPDGKRIAIGQGPTGVDPKPGKIRILSFPEGETVLDLAGHELGVRALAFSADGKRLASASDDTTVLLWDVGGR